MMKKH